MVATAVSDPKAEEYAKQQAIQKKQDEEVRQREAAASKASAEADAKKKSAAEASADLASRSQMNPSKAAADIAKSTLNWFFFIFLAMIALYGGSIAANMSIGYNVPFRRMSFVYGTLMFFLVIPYYIYLVYFKNQTIPYYSFFPTNSTYVPIDTLEQILYGWYCYKEDDASKAARAIVQKIYESGFKRSLDPVKPKNA